MGLFVNKAFTSLQA